MRRLSARIRWRGQVRCTPAGESHGAPTHARLDNPGGISSYSADCCEIARGEGQRVLGFSTGERTAIFTSLTSPR